MAISDVELFSHALGYADDTHFLGVDECTALGGGASDIIVDAEFCGEVKGCFVERFHPHFSRDVFVCEDDALLVVDAGVDDDGRKIVRCHFFQRVIEVEKLKSEIFEPVDVYGVVDMSDEVYVIRFDADFQFSKKGLAFVHGESYSFWASRTARSMSRLASCALSAWRLSAWSLPLQSPT